MDSDTENEIRWLESRISELEHRIQQLEYYKADEHHTHSEGDIR